MNAITTFDYEYTIDGAAYEGFVALPMGAPRKVVLVCHAWGGLGENERLKAELIAGDLGYAAFAVDVYGKGKRGTTVEECQALMNPLVANRAQLQHRLAGGIAAAKRLEKIEPSARAAVGYCFGGLCVLDMARANMDVGGVAAIHGLFHAADNLRPQKISPRVIAFHGWDDPMATPEDVMAFSKEMTAAQADWQLHAFGGVKHAFTTRGANNPELGTIYDAAADQRSWAGLRQFLGEVLG